MEMLCGALAKNNKIKTILLKGNRVTTHGMLSLVQTCMTPGNSIQSLDLQQNRVTLDALEALAFLVYVLFFLSSTAP